MGKVWELDLPPNEKLVLLALADHSDHDGSNVRPGVELIAMKTGLSQREVQYVQKRLREAGILIPEANLQGGRGIKISYRIDVQKGATLAYFLERKRAQGVHPLIKEKSARDAGFEVEKGASGAGIKAISKNKRVQTETQKGANEFEQIGENIEKPISNHHEPSNTPPNPLKGEEAVNPVQEVFTYWQRVMEKPGAKLTNERKQKIEARLKQGYSVTEIKLGVDGCKLSPHHMGQNDQKKLYNDLIHICRNGSKLEGFIEHAKRNVKQSGPNGKRPAFTW